MSPLDPRKGIAPPPTRFGTPGAMQAASPNSAARTIVQPPPTRFAGAAPACNCGPTRGHPTSGSCSPRAAPALQPKVIQRAHAVEVRLPAALTGKYADFYRLYSCYSPDACHDGQILRKLKIGQALGLAGPDSVGHCSDPSSDSDSTRATDNKGYYDAWLATNGGAIDGAFVVEPSVRSGSSSRVHSEQERIVSAVNKGKTKKVKADAKKAKWHRKDGHVVSPNGYCNLCHAHY